MDTSWQCTFWPLRSGAASGRWTVNVGGRAKAVPNQKGASQIDSTWSARLEGLIPSDRSQYHLHGILHKPPTPPSIATPSSAARVSNATLFGNRTTRAHLVAVSSAPIFPSPSRLPPTSLRRKRAMSRGPSPPGAALSSHLCSPMRRRGVGAALSSSLCSPMRCRRRRGHVERRWWRG